MGTIQQHYHCTITRRAYSITGESHSFGDYRYRLHQHEILFDEVDVATAIERGMAGHSQNITSIIRAANKKTFREIHHEIRVAQVEVQR